ncbi:MAG: hypothetical protein AAF612_03765 [Planctomycetota bacterium]
MNAASAEPNADDAVQAPERSVEDQLEALFAQVEEREPGLTAKAWGQQADAPPTPEAPPAQAQPEATAESQPEPEPEADAESKPAQADEIAAAPSSDNPPAPAPPPPPAPPPDNPFAAELLAAVNQAVVEVVGEPAPPRPRADETPAEATADADLPPDPEADPVAEVEAALESADQAASATVDQAPTDEQAQLLAEVQSAIDQTLGEASSADAAGQPAPEALSEPEPEPKPEGATDEPPPGEESEEQRLLREIDQLLGGAATPSEPEAPVKPDPAAEAAAATSEPVDTPATEARSEPPTEAPAEPATAHAPPPPTPPSADAGPGEVDDLDFTFEDPAQVAAGSGGSDTAPSPPEPHTIEALDDVLAGEAESGDVELDFDADFEDYANTLGVGDPGSPGGATASDVAAELDAQAASARRPSTEPPTLDAPGDAGETPLALLTKLAATLKPAAQRAPRLARIALGWANLPALLLPATWRASLGWIGLLNLITAVAVLIYALLS